MNATGKLETSGQATDDVTIALAVQLNLPSFALHQLRLVATFDRAQLFRTAPRHHYAGNDKRQKADQQQHCQDDIEQANSAETFEHSSGLGVKIRRGGVDGAKGKAPSALSNLEISGWLAALSMVSHLLTAEISRFNFTDRRFHGI